jgi:hypothetical protein
MNSKALSIDSKGRVSSIIFNYPMAGMRSPNYLPLPAESTTTRITARSVVMHISPS